MIQTYSTTIRRKEMDAVLTCMVDEKIGPGELNTRLIQQVKDFLNCDGAVALRSPCSALKYALRALNFEQDQVIMISALAPAWHIQAIEDLGYKSLVLDVDENTGLVTTDIVKEGISNGGRLILLHETNGILPDLQELCNLEIPLIEDISQSAGASVAIYNEEGALVENKKAGSFGVFSILGLEERDVLTSGGGAILMAPKRREWIVLKKFVDNISSVELLPDINCSLAWVQIKEFTRNENARKEIFNLFHHTCLSGKHKMFIRTQKKSQNVQESSSEAENKTEDNSSTMCGFPLVLTSSFKDVKQYAAKKDIEIRQTFENSVIALREEDLSTSCIHAKSLYLRCASFPLYPRLSHSQTAKIAKVLGTLP